MSMGLVAYIVIDADVTSTLMFGTDDDFDLAQNIISVTDVRNEKLRSKEEIDCWSPG